MIEIYRSYIGANGLSLRERTISEHMDDLCRNASSSPDFHCDTMRNGIQQPFILTRGGEAHTYNVICMPGDNLYAGDMIDAFGQKWLVMEARADMTTHKTGIMKQCNHLFKFQNFTSAIIERWGIIDQSGYSSTVTGTNQMQKSEEQVAIYLPYDDDTSKIYVDKRLASHIAYEKSGRKILATFKVTSHSPNSYSYNDLDHLLVLKAIRDVYSESADNIDLMVCDYIPPADTPEPPESEKLSCMISGKAKLYLGRTRTYSPVFYQADGISLADGITASWSYEPRSGITVSADGNSLKIYAEPKDFLIGEVMRIVLSDTNGVYEPATLDVEVTNIA